MEEFDHFIFISLILLLLLIDHLCLLNLKSTKIISQFNLLTFLPMDLTLIHNYAKFHN